VAIAATVYCPERYISSATWSLWPLSTEGRPPRRPRARAAARPAPGAFADEVAFELGEGGEDVEDEFAAGGGGVDRLLEAAEPDAAVGEAGDGVDQVPQGAAEAVEFPDDQGVARRRLVQDLLEDGAVAAGAIGGLGEHPAAASRREGVDLALGLLVAGGDAGTAWAAGGFCTATFEIGARRPSLPDRANAIYDRAGIVARDFGHGF
jgi:hypothetical protein